MRIRAKLGNTIYKIKSLEKFEGIKKDRIVLKRLSLMV